MSFPVDFYMFAKKNNSTLSPAVAPNSTYQCVLKEPTDIISPTIILSLAPDDNPTSLNYARIEMFGRYYYVTDWVYDRGVWNAQLQVDVLASWKAQISTMSAYVVRAASVSDGSIVDNYYPTTADCTYYQQGYGTIWDVGTGPTTGGRYVVGIRSAGTQYYIFTAIQYISFLGYILSDRYADDLLDGWQTEYPELKVNANPLQYISSIQYAPYTPPTLGPSSSIPVGWVSVPGSGGAALLQGTTYTAELSITCPRHPLSSTRGEYLNLSPFSRYAIFVPPWGLIDIDSEFVANTSAILIVYRADPATGSGSLRIYNDSNNLYTSVRAQVNVPIQASEIRATELSNTQQMLDITSSTLGAVGQLAGSAISGNVVGVAQGGISAFEGFRSALKDAAEARIPRVRTIGSVGSFESLLGEVQMFAQFSNVVDEDNANMGRPVCKFLNIGSLSGFMQTQNTPVVTFATQSEQNAIKRQMEGGFYFE